MAPEAVRMSKATSLLLDFVRVSAALAVFASHCNWAWYPDRGILRWRGPDGGIIFFILLGHRIFYVAFFRETRPKPFIPAPLAPAYSLVLSALLLPPPLP